MGTDKAWLPWKGRTLLEHVVATVSDFCETVIVVHAPGQVLPTLPAAITLLSDVQSDLGPLGGLFTGLKFLCGTHDAVFVTPCDAPFINSAMASMLLQNLGECDAVIFSHELGYQPIPGVYRTRILSIVERRLSQTHRSLRGLLSEIKTATLDKVWLAKHPEYRKCIRDMNTQQEYTASLSAESK